MQRIKISRWIRADHREEMIKLTLQTPKKGLAAGFLAPPARLELTTLRLGGARSVQVSYGGLCKNYSIFRLKRKRTDCRLGGECSILLSYGDRLYIWSFKDSSALIVHCRKWFVKPGE